MGKNDVHNTKITKPVQVSSLAAKLVFYTVLSSTLVTLFTTTYQLYAEYQSSVSSIELRLEEINNSYTDNIASRLWVANTEELQLTIKGLLRLPDIEYIEIYEDNVLLTKEGQIPQTNTIERTFPLTYIFRGKPQHIGRIHITASLERTYQLLIDRAISILVSNAVKTFIISGFMLFLFYQLIARHLITLGHFAGSLDLSALDNKLHLKRRQKSGQFDEIDQLGNTLLTLQERLKESLHELKRSQAKTLLILNTAAEAIFGIDDDGNCTFANQSCITMLGYDNETQLLGENMHQLIHHTFVDGSDYPVSESKIYKAFLEHTNSHVDNEVLWRKDGSHFYAEYWSHPIFEGGQCIGAVVTFLDISNRRKSDQEKEALLKSLENQNEELELFTYTVSHDLKSPLVTISGFVGALEKDIADGNKQRIASDLSRIKNAAETMQHLLDDLLRLSRIGRVETSRIDVSLDTIIDSAMQMLESTIQSTEANIIIESGLPTIRVEEIPFKEVYLNLIGNAIKYRREGVNPKITIGVQVAPDDDKKILFFVRDNGIGINPRYHNKIFGLFERLNTVHEGTGIGLAIVKRIIEVHNGKIWVESNSNNIGSTFYFTLSETELKFKD